MTINQAYLFIVFIINGIFIGVLFDFFRILRKSFKTINFITNIEDIIFWILAGISVIFCMYKFTDGSIRLFMFIGLIFGITTYILTISTVIINISVKILTIVKKIIKFILCPFKIFFDYIKEKMTKKVKKM